MSSQGESKQTRLEILADQAIGHDLCKGLIELITNSDDSYGRLEAGAMPANGRIGFASKVSQAVTEPLAVASGIKTQLTLTEVALS